MPLPMAGPGNWGQVMGGFERGAIAMASIDKGLILLGFPGQDSLPWELIETSTY